MNQVSRQHRRKRSMNRIVVWSVSLLVTVFVLANVGMAVAYRHRALPRFFIGRQAVGGLQLSNLQHFGSSTILPKMITLQKDSTQKKLSPTDLGLSLDTSTISSALQHTKLRWLPLLSLASSHHVALGFTVNQTVSEPAVAQLAQTFSRPSLPKHIAYQGSFVVAPAETGYKLTTDTFLSSLQTALKDGKSTLTVQTTSLPAVPDNTSLNLADRIQVLQKQITVQLSFVYQGQSVTPSSADIASWFAPSGADMQLSPANISSYIEATGRKAGIAVANQSDLTTATAYALSKLQPLKFALVPSSPSTVARTYCTNVRGVSNAVLEELQGKLAATYADTRGWNDSGQIAFKHVTSGCQYTVWMAASSQMTSFGSICDNYYNCQIGTNVVMNYDRWTSATPPWNQAGGSLEDYHTLMIDHETGHRLGFRDNPTCPGAGQPAPVMMQQSIDLKGCVFNIWPRPAEFTQLQQLVSLPASNVNIQE